jgi:hypothetical protein
MSSHPSISTNAGSNLLQTMLDKIQLRWEGSLSPPPPEIFSIIGDLTFLQLSTLRHRGAVSTVSLTFTKCCALTQVEPQIASSAVDRLQSWYKVCDQLATSPIVSYHSRVPYAAFGSNLQLPEDRRAYLPCSLLLWQLRRKSPRSRG